jgi:hypothetical protein
MNRRVELSRQANSLNLIILKAELYTAQTALTQCYNCQNFGHVWANCIGNALERQIQNLHRAAAVAPHPASYRVCSHAKLEEHNERLSIPLGGRYFLSSPHQSSAVHLYCVKTPATTGTADRWKKRVAPVQQHLPQQGIQKTGSQYD